MFVPRLASDTSNLGIAIVDQISGWGALASWNWCIANVRGGLIAGLAPLYLQRRVNGSTRDGAIAAGSGKAWQGTAASDSGAA